MTKEVIFGIHLIAGFFRALGARACRFHPSCSHYAVQAFEAFGFFKAFGLTAKRLLRCQPFSKGGYDPLTGKV
jgi:hypothetical protein